MRFAANHRKGPQVRRILLFSLMSFVMGCQQHQDVEADEQAIETTIRDFFGDMSTFDLDAIRNRCAPDFVLLEEGLQWNTDSLVNAMAGFKGKATITYTLGDMQSHVEGSIGWITYRNDGLVTMNGKETLYRWMESAVLRKTNGIWRLVLLHSTRISPA